MQALYTLVLFVHVLASSVGLLALVPPLVAKKGGRVHGAAGRVFVRSMLVSAVSGALMAAAWALEPAAFRASEPPTAARVSGLFLLLIGVLTGNAVLQAMRALERKRAPGAQANPRHLGSVAALAAVGLLTLGVGVVHTHVLSLLFGPLALFVSMGDAAFVLRPLSHPRAYLVQHVRAMGTASISAVTAFAVIGGRRWLGSDVFQGQAWLMWVLPGVLLGPLFARWVRIYKAKLAPQGRPVGAPTHEARALTRPA